LTPPPPSAAPPPSFVTPRPPPTSSPFPSTTLFRSAPTGTITYTYFQQASAPSSCTSGGTSIGTATVSANGAYSPSAGFTPTIAGNYWLYASYNGDTHNNTPTTTCPTSTSHQIVVAT